MVADTPPTGPDPEPYLESIRQYEEAGYTEIYKHQIGPGREGFFRFYEREIMPEL
jgi:coenzyme F420-dependent glucose-6-phosphate dehydrogenase